MPILDMSNFPLLSLGSVEAPTPVPAIVAQIEIETTRLRFRGLDFVRRAADSCSPETLGRLDALAKGVRMARTKDRAELLSLKQLYEALELGEPSRIKLALETYAALMRLQGNDSVFLQKCTRLAAEL